MECRSVLWTNPLIEQRADPWVMYHEGSYYFVATSPEYDRIELRKAHDLAGLSKAQDTTVWRCHEKGEMANHIWAPELHHIDGSWYIYFAAGHSEDQWQIRMYALVCRDMNPLTGEWEEVGRIRSKWDTFSLDATVMKYNGKHYFIWAQSDPDIEGNSNIYIDEMSDPVTLAGRQVMLTTPEYPWEVIGYKVNEGPAVVMSDAYVFLTYSASKTDYNYCMGMLKMKQGDDPMKAENWEKSQEPVFATHEENKVFGPGHNSFVQMPDGQTAMVYHARNYKEIVGDPLEDPNRHTRVQLVNVKESTIEFGEPAVDGDYKG